MSAPDPNPGAAAAGRFPATRLSVCEAVRSDDAEQRRIGWEALVEAYWKPVYKHVRWKWRADREEAADLTQEFFARALEKEFFVPFDPARARFRTFLRVCLDGFVANQRQAAARLKRGGGVPLLSLDFATAEGELDRVAPQAGDDFDATFHREWMRALFAAALADLRAHCTAEGRAHDYELLRRYDLEGDDGASRPTYADLARESGLPVTQVTNFLARARRELRERVLARLRAQCSDDAEFREEARALLGVTLP